MGEFFIPSMVILVGVFMIWMSISIKNKQNDGERWVQDIYKKKNIVDENVEFILSNSIYNNFLIYTKENNLYVVNKSIKVIDEIDLLDILKIDVEAYMSEKNTKRLIALTSTFDKNVKITGIDFKITTRSGVFVIPCMINQRSSSGALVLNSQVFLDDVNRCKLILEDDIKKLNSLKI